MTTTTASYVARQSQTYTDAMVADLRAEVMSLRTEVVTHMTVQDAQDHKVKIAAHFACILGGLGLTLLMIHLAVSAYLAAGVAVAPTAVQEIVDFARKL